MTEAHFLPLVPNIFSANPERIGIIQPKVARNELPWVGISWSHTLKELNRVANMASAWSIQPLQGWHDFKRTQGSRCCANPGLNDHNPVRLALHPELNDLNAVEVALSST